MRRVDRVAPGAQTQEQGHQENYEYESPFFHGASWPPSASKENPEKFL
jgi:hypothetical protein